ncbi:MAG: zf-HC2 domain-containing protein [Myxococcales bacterium]|nr:zf-HC2 domain-containing protein [Myxococcales bacterium]
MSDLTPHGTERIGCPSDLRLDRLVAGELEAEDRAQLGHHLEQCSACARRHGDFADAARRFAEHGESFDQLRVRVQRRREGRQASRRRTRGLWGVSALAAAAAVALAVQGGLPLGTATEATTRSKGKARIGFYVKRGERVVEGGADTILHPGDRLRFVLSTPRPRYLALLNRDGRGASVYYPSGERALPLPAGHDRALDFSVELDDYLGDERVFALLCSEAFPVEPLRLALARDGALTPPSGCSLLTLDLHKEPLP